MNAPSPHPPTVRTTCPYCGVGCGVLARPDGYGGAAITGDPDHPANFGRICSKGSALGETLGLGERLLHPMLRQADGSLARVDWSVALDRVAAGFQRIVTRHGPDAIAFYLSGQLLTEDYYVANKLMKGFIGSANVDTNSRLCMASSVAGHKRAFGADTVPGSYEDLDQADLLVLVGSNAAWCHPVLFQRMVANKRKRGAKIVVIDPRRTATAEDADLYLRDRARHGHGAVLRAAGASRRPVRARLSLHRRAHDGLREYTGAGARASPLTSPPRRGSRAYRRPMSRASSTCSVPHPTRSPAFRKG